MVGENSARLLHEKEHMLLQHPALLSHVWQMQPRAACTQKSCHQAAEFLVSLASFTISDSRDGCSISPDTVRTVHHVFLLQGTLACNNLQDLGSFAC